MTDTTTQRWLAFDIGGANLKAAHSEGLAISRPFELWKRPDDLAAALLDLAATMPAAGAWAVTMTAELCDCFATKAEGVRSILAATTRAAGNRPVRVWGTDGRFHEVAAILDQPRLAAASNWLALATVVARSGFADSGLLIDVGSTTTDLIPWRDGAVVIEPADRTDLGRLQTHALVYAGVRRTPLCAFNSSLFYRGVFTPIMAELFATTADVFLTLGDLPPDPFDHATCDGQPMTLDAARARLARMIGLDRDDFTAEDAQVLARDAQRNLMVRLAQAVELVVANELGHPPAVVVLAGSGEFLARRLADRVFPPGSCRLVSLSETWGLAASTAACAHALLVLLQTERIG